MNAYKAWVDYGEGSAVVFAETRNQAKVIALSCDCCEDAKYTDIRVHRMKELDHLYKGESEMDWYDDERGFYLCVTSGGPVWNHRGSAICANANNIAAGTKSSSQTKNHLIRK